MRELHTIEVDRWEPSEKKGMVRHAGMISPQEAFDALEKHLKEANLMPDEYFNPNSWYWKDVKELPDYVCADCNVNWGGNEGIYLDVSLLYRDEKQELKRFQFATGKTLGRTGDDFLRMSRIAAECSMMLNGRGDRVRFYEEPETIQLTEREKGLVAKALDFYGDRVADTQGYSAGEKYWDLKAKLEGVKNIQAEKTPEEKLIEAVAEYGLEYSWTDNDVIDSLVDMGITKEDFIKCGKYDFVKEYFESDDKEDQQFEPLDSVIREANIKQQAALEEVAEFLGAIKGNDVADFKKKYGITPGEILSNSSLLAQVAADKQRLGADTEIALHNVCLTLQENKHASRLAELRKLKQER